MQAPRDACFIKRGEPITRPAGVTFGMWKTPSFPTGAAGMRYAPHGSGARNGIRECVCVGVVGGLSISSINRAKSSPLKGTGVILVPFYGLKA